MGNAMPNTHESLEVPGKPGKSSVETIKYKELQVTKDPVEPEYKDEDSGLCRMMAKELDDFHWRGKEMRVYVYECYDGDTLKVLFKDDKCDRIWKMSIRVNGIDTPEIRGKNKDLEKKVGKRIRDLLNHLLDNTYVTATFVDWDKYSCRIVADVKIESKEYGIEETTLSEILLDHGLAKPYHGKKKEKWTDVELAEAMSDIDKFCKKFNIVVKFKDD